MCGARVTGCGRSAGARAAPPSANSRLVLSLSHAPGLERRDDSLMSRLQISVSTRDGADQLPIGGHSLPTGLFPVRLLFWDEEGVA